MDSRLLPTDGCSCFRSVRSVGLDRGRGEREGEYYATNICERDISTFFIV